MSSFVMQPLPSQPLNFGVSSNVAPAVNVGKSVASGLSTAVNGINTIDPTAAHTAGTSAAPTAAQQQAQQQADLSAQYNDQANQLQNQVGNLDGQFQNGYNRIANQYGQNFTQLQDQQALAQHQYDTTKQQNVQNFAATRNNAQTQVRANGSALQRLLGINGAGNSSAAYDLAPYAAALQGSQIISGAQQTYGQNAANADNNWQQTQLSAKQQRDALEQSKNDNLTSLQQNIANSRATLLDQIRTAKINADMANGTGYQTAANNQKGYSDQISGLLAQISQLGNVAPKMYAPADIKFNTPDQSQYSMVNAQGPSQSTPAGQSDVSQSFLSLLGNNQKRDAYGNLVNA